MLPPLIPVIWKKTLLNFRVHNAMQMLSTLRIGTDLYKKASKLVFTDYKVLCNEIHSFP